MDEATRADPDGASLVLVCGREMQDARMERAGPWSMWSGGHTLDGDARGEVARRRAERRPAQRQASGGGRCRMDTSHHHCRLSHS